MKQAELFEAPREALASMAVAAGNGDGGIDAAVKPVAAVETRSKVARIVALASQGVLTDAERGELDTLLDRHVPVDSSRLLHFLYDPSTEGGWGLPPRYIKEGSRNTTRLSRGLDALLSLYRIKKDQRLALVLRLLRLRAEAEALNVKADRE